MTHYQEENERGGKREVAPQFQSAERKELSTQNSIFTENTFRNEGEIKNFQMMQS